MPRVGRHPLKERSLVLKGPIIQQVTVTTITYIPMLEGYWQESLEVLKLFFESLYAHTLQPFDLMVFDNGSCDEVKSYLADLQKQGKIQYLIFSEQNLRKLGALNFLLSAAPGEYIAYADSDVYFLPGWLEESIKVLETFPEAGRVTALPLMSGDSSRFPAYGKALNDPSIDIQTGLLIPKYFIEAHQISLGKTITDGCYDKKDRNDVLLTRNKCKAYLSGADFQFVIEKKIAQKMIPLKLESSVDYYDPIYSPVLEKHLAESEYWELSTKDYLVHHMGNRIPDLKNELPWLNNLTHKEENFPLQSSIKRNSYENNAFQRIKQNRYFRRILKKIYLTVYRLMFE